MADLSREITMEGDSPINESLTDGGDIASAEAASLLPDGAQVNEGAVERAAKPTKFYVDFENVHGAGLKGVDELAELDEVLIFYSQAAETFHIEHAIDILKSKARIQFVEVDAGTRNAADFQLIVALVGAMDPAYDYVIVTGDGGFDAAIKMAERMGLPSVRRVSNVRGEVIDVEKPKSRRSRRRGGSSTTSDDQGEKGAQPSDADDGDNRAKSEVPGRTAVSSTAEKSGESRRSGKTKRGAKPIETGDAEKPKAHAAADAVEGAKDADGNQDEAIVSTADTGAQAASDEVKRSRGRRRRGGHKIGYPSGEGASKESGEASKDTGERPAAAVADAGEAAAPPEEKPSLDDRVGEKSEHGDQASSGDGEEPAHDEAEAIPSAKLASFLAEKGVNLDDEQLEVVAKALEGAKDRQDFYRSIIRALRKDRGLPLYYQVRDHFAEMRKM